MKIYLVGGAVRDGLLNRTVIERDWVVVGANSETLLNQGYTAVGRDFPVFLHPETKEEYALARTERKTGVGYTGFACSAEPNVTLEEDLLRRDLTINAMAMSDAGDIIDPYGGQQDLQDKLLRHVSPAFAEDPLRVLRVARFAARYAHLGFTVAPQTRALMYSMAKSGELAHLVAERVWKEMERSLGERSPQVFFQVLRACNALKVLLPELDCLYGIPNPPRWHPEVDSGVHTMMVLARASTLSSSLEVRFAAVMHDLGKGLTPSELWPSHRGHEEKGVSPIMNICQRFKLPHKYKELAILASCHHILVHKVAELRASTIVSLLEKTDAFRRPQRFEDLLLVCQADSEGRGELPTKPYQQAVFLRAVLAELNKIEVKSILETGLQGAAIKNEIHRLRVNRVKQLCSQWAWEE